MRLMFKYVKPYWKSVIVIFILVTLTAMGNLLLPNYMSKMIGEGIKPVYETYDESTGTFVSTDYCDVTQNPDTCRVVGQTSDLRVILNYGLIMLSVTLGSSIAWISLAYVSSRVASLTGKSIREDLYRKISSFSLAEADLYGTSTLITRSTNDVMQVQNYLIMFLRLVLRIPIMFVGALVMSWQKASELMNVLLMGLPVLVIIIAVTFVLVVPLFRAIQKKVDNLTRISREGIKGVRVIRAFGKGVREVKRFKTANEDLTATMIKTGKIMSILNPAVNLVFSVVTLGVVFLSFRAITGGNASNYADLANVSAVMQYSFQAMFSLLMLTMTFIMYPRAQVSSSRIKEILEQKIIVKDEGDPKYDNYDFKGEVNFNNVCFKYQDAEQNVLEGITFQVNPGETVALIGSTGSGKSTAINLLPRFFDVTCGSITIDSVDIRQIKLNKLRSLMGFVPQTATLFSGTIKENIAYGKPDATQEEVEWAAKVGQAEEFITQIDEGYDAFVEQGGVNLSGGQKQRLAIARALIRKPKIYVFDDSFSALDFMTDAKLRKALRENTADAAVLIVAQRIGTIMDADRIVVLHEGRIQGIGTHKELLQTCEVYREIALSQLTEEELAHD